MKIGNFDTGERVLIVAEIGQNHEGSETLASEMVEAAAAAGADAVKLQTFRAEDFVSPCDSERLTRMKEFELDANAHARLAALTRERGLLFLSTPLDLGSVRMLEPLVDAYKVASADNSFFPLLEAVGTTGKPVIVSGGMSDIAGLKSVEDTLGAIWDRTVINGSLAFLHCVTAYPVPPEHANLAAITALREVFDCTIGYSDHTLGIEAPVLAVALGARIVEKHFTLDKGLSDFRDHQLSADTEEFGRLVSRIREAETLLGKGEKCLLSIEEPLVRQVRRSIAAARDLEAGVIVGEGDVTWLRPGDGIPPDRENEVVGRRLVRPMSRGDLFDPADLEQG